LGLIWWILSGYLLFNILSIYAFFRQYSPDILSETIELNVFLGKILWSYLLAPFIQPLIILVFSWVLFWIGLICTFHLKQESWSERRILLFSLGLIVLACVPIILYLFIGIPQDFVGLVQVIAKEFNLTSDPDNINILFLLYNLIPLPIVSWIHIWVITRREKPRGFRLTKHSLTTSNGFIWLLFFMILLPIIFMLTTSIM
jgi:hypothetical protein